MPSAFDAAWLRASPAIDAVFGSTFEYQPMIANNGGRSLPDPAREAKIITGALTEDATFVYPETRSRRGSAVAQEASEMITIDIALDALPYAAQSGDRLQLVTLNTAGAIVSRGALFKVNGPQPDGIARNELRVVKLLADPGR